MTTGAIADRYRILSDRFATLVAAVPPDKWSAASPCEGWTALDVVRHIVDVHAMFEKLAGRPIELPAVDHDPLSAFREAQGVVQADLDDPERAGTEWDGFFGRTNFAEGVDRFVAFDLIVHGWDLARAADLGDSIPDADLDRLEGDIAFFGDAMTGSGIFAQPLDPPPGADRQTRVLAALGRSAA